mmetsp:Transcript_60506/g.170481  ORF Transcript_60506/g.170481 Transcript_60506/m.170481 type:complete len:230 (+) Transcript_60506:1427-2116(+)
MPASLLRLRPGVFGLQGAAGDHVVGGRASHDGLPGFRLRRRPRQLAVRVVGQQEGLVLPEVRPRLPLSLDAAASASARAGAEVADAAAATAGAISGTIDGTAADNTDGGSADGTTGYNTAGGTADDASTLLPPCETISVTYNVTIDFTSGVPGINELRQHVRAGGRDVELQGPRRVHLHAQLRGEGARLRAGPRLGDVKMPTLRRMPLGRGRLQRHIIGSNQGGCHIDP